MSRTAEHRPARRRRRFRHDDLFACELFSGFGGLTQGAEQAGFTNIVAANHNAYKVEVHEANHPYADHWIADLVDPDSSDYHSARDLPAADMLLAGVSCVNHSGANSQRAYAEGLSLFDLDDPDFDARVTRSERDRATANCVLHYAAEHHPRVIVVECTTELVSWGPALPGRRKIGDGSTYRWWLKQFQNLGYHHKLLYLNSQFFGVGQSRDRGYWVFWDRRLPQPDLEHRPESWCDRCSRIVQAVWSWRTGVPASGSVRYGKQYDYRCPSCRREVIPPMTPSLAALDLTDLGTRIGDKPVRKHKDGSVGPLAAATMARAERCRQRFAEFPAVLMPAKAIRGSERHPWQPMGTQTSQQETGLLSTGALMAAAGNTFERPGSDCRSRRLDQPMWAQTATNATGLLTPPVATTVDGHQPEADAEPASSPSADAAVVAVDNYQGSPRSASESLPTQVGSETLALVSSGVVPFRQNTVPTGHTEPMPTVTSDQIPGMLTAAGTVKNNGSIDEAKYRAKPVTDPFGAFVSSSASQALLFSGWYKQNGSAGDETASHPLTDPLGALTSRDTTALLLAEWRAALAEIPLENCYFRMLSDPEIGRGCGFDVDFPGGYRGTFKVWGSARDRVDGYGNAVTPAVSYWIGARLRPSLHTTEAVL